MASAVHYAMTQEIPDSFSPMWVGQVKGPFGCGRPAVPAPMSVPLLPPGIHAMLASEPRTEFQVVEEEVEQQLVAELEETNLELFRLQQKLMCLQERQNLQRLQQQQLIRAPPMPLTPPGIHLPRSSPPPPPAAAAPTMLPPPAPPADVIRPPPGLLPPGLHLPPPPLAAAPRAEMFTVGKLAATTPNAFMENEPAMIYAEFASSPNKTISGFSSETCSTADETGSSPSFSTSMQEDVPTLNWDGVDAANILPPGIPSIGSIGHHAGLCKPCDFVGRGSCRAEGSCKFCHLCGPTERKQRKAERRKLMRTACGGNCTMVAK